MKTLQEIFDLGLAHIRRQGTFCRKDLNHAACSYRDGKGNACIVGGLFPDSTYDPIMDSHNGAGGVAAYASVLDLPDSEVLSMERAEQREAAQLMYAALLAEGIDMKDDSVLTLLMSMQYAHDSSSHDGQSMFMWQFEARMKAVAVNHRLTYTKA